MTFLLSACGDDFTPRGKEAVYDPATGQTVLPYPCPDWSQPSPGNYDNSPHSNFGCAVNNNLAVQLENPGDLYQGHGAIGSDTESSVRIIERYRAGEIPEPLQPSQELGGQ